MDPGDPRRPGLRGADRSTSRRKVPRGRPVELRARTVAAVRALGEDKMSGRFWEFPSLYATYISKYMTPRDFGPTTTTGPRAWRRQP